MKLKLGLITLISAFNDAARIENSHYNFISGLRQHFDISFIDPEDTDSVDLPIVFIGSGGIEGYFKSIYDKLLKPVILLTDGLQNSLAASMEILAWIKEIGDDSIILHGNIEETVAQIEYNYAVVTARKRMKEASIGVIGFPSEWLIASGVSYIDAQRKWGVQFRNIELHELGQFIEEASIDKASRIADSFIEAAALVKEPNEKDIIEAAKVYLAIKAISEDYGFDAVTVRCFDLITKYGTTGCLAVSLLNNENVVSACEGDCQGAFSMLLLNFLTGSKVFMANPCNLDFEKNDIILAHCTIPTDMVEKYTIRNHFESRTGVAVQGEVAEGPVTIFKCGGSKLDKYFLSSGRIIGNLDDDNLCRTQLKIHMDGDISYFIRNPIANHHMIIKGDHTRLVEYFMKAMGCSRVF